MSSEACLNLTAFHNTCLTQVRPALPWPLVFPFNYHSVPLNQWSSSSPSCVSFSSPASTESIMYHFCSMLCPVSFLLPPPYPLSLPSFGLGDPLVLSQKRTHTHTHTHTPGGALRTMPCWQLCIPDSMKQVLLGSSAPVCVLSDFCH